MRCGLLVVVSGPSGVGKTTVVDRLLSRPGFTRAVTATTRAPRPGEQDGRDYHFLAGDEFEKRVRAGRFLEHAVVHGNRYGTPREEVEAILAEGGVCLLNVDVQGAASLRGTVEPALFVFLRPPSLEALAARLARRGTESEAAAARRLAAAAEEMAREGEFDATVVNDDLERAVEEIAARIEERSKEESCRRRN